VGIAQYGRTMAAQVASPRVRRTDRALCAASIRVAAEEGWGDFTFARVARQAGTSRRPLQDRFTGRSELAASTWSESAEPVLRGLLVEFLASAGLLHTDPDHERLVAVMDLLAHPAPEVQAAVEFLIVAQFEPALRSAVASTLGAEISRWCAPQDGVLSAEDAARRAFMLSAALGLVLVARRPGVERIDVAHIAEVLLRALSVRVAPRSVPTYDTSHIDDPVPFVSGDEVRDRLLQATLDIVGESGYDAATVDAIAHRAGSSQGALFARFPTKVALFLDASRHQAAHAMRANEEWMERIAAVHGRGMAEAAFIRESQRPGRDRLRIIALEQMRTGWHEPVIREAIAREYAAFVAEAHATRPGFNLAESHVGFAIGGGTLLLAVLCPDAWLLPYDVVTVAWEG
jgi:AcrR family transcriptional regulator